MQDPAAGPVRDVKTSFSKRHFHSLSTYKRDGVTELFICRRAGQGWKERQRGEGRERKGEMGEGEVRGREKRFRKHVGRERDREGCGQALRKRIS